MNKIQSCKWMLSGVLVFGVLLGAFSVFAQNSDLEVKCVDASNAPAQNVRVAIINIDTKKARDKKSDAQGIAGFDKADNGVYRVVGRKEGFAPALYELVLLKGGKESVTLKLAAGADAKLYFEDPALEQNAVNLLKQGLESFKQGNAAEAEKYMRQSLDINPSSAETLYYLGMLLLRQAKFEQGTEILTRAIAVSNIRKTLAGAAPAGQQNAYELIARNAQQNLNQIPVLKAENAFNQQKYDDAVALYKEAIQSNPGSGELYANMARALAQAKRNDEALAAVNKAIELKPADNSFVTLKNTLTARMQAAQLEKAQGLLNEGTKLFEAGDFAGALRKYEEANGLVPQDRQAPLWRQIGRSHAKLNHPEEAVAAFRKSMELAPADKASEYRMSFAQFYLDAKKFEEAVDIMADPKSAGSGSPEQILMDLAAKVTNQEPRLAQASLERVIKLNPDNANAHYLLGRLYYMDKANDKRTKELLTRFVQIGADADKLEDAKGMLLLVNRRSK